MGKMKSHKSTDQLSVHSELESLSQTEQFIRRVRALYRSWEPAGITPYARHWCAQTPAKHLKYD